jgi:digalactosyldiacylglycerol synthase
MVFFFFQIQHTNYKEYISGHISGLWSAPGVELINSAMVRAYCHKIIKLSDTLQTYAPEKEVPIHLLK